MGLLISRRLRGRLDLGPGPRTDNSPADRFHRARLLAELLREDRPNDEEIRAGTLHALEQLEDALRAYLLRSLGKRAKEVLQRALEGLEKQLGGAAVERLLTTFEQEYLDTGASPSALVAATGTEPGTLRRLAVLVELLIFSLVAAGPATRETAHALHGDLISTDPVFDSLTRALTEILAAEPGLLADDDNLIAGLERPFAEAATSIADQLRWVLEHWSDVAPEIEPSVVAALDLLAEEERPRFAPGPGPVELPTFESSQAGEVRYGAERSWMPGLVLAAKNSYVWLDQLSKSAGREIGRLDQIPDSELDKLARLGINGLWLIGLWERSRASRRIKQLCGNPEAAASAYSLRGYRIAADLGGDAALDRLQRQAARFGIRLAADMVPNHTGIDSDWLIEHPEWFLSTPYCPFPSYRFDGPDLSSDPRVGIFLEDHYYDRTDAAVVFKRVDNRTGETRFVYHGNDGTGTPWNDTAQLDYLNSEARGAVAETILRVARRFPIVRFDAAMTLAKEHIQRLWHPQPGSAGAIPSRAEHTMAAERFNALMPGEFWREIVDRASVEAPDTLLLAEAFWLMETYFIRQLGVHRVYNSAFMNMLRDGDNQGYRKLLREALAFDPRLLERYVNFLSNPDEETAAEQFGTGDRYFGACVLLATLPGLPMFAHGQLQGLSERYGMEYRRSYRDEAPNPRVLERHQREITPLLERRSDFATTEGFALHDLRGAAGQIFDNVIAYLNGSGAQRSLVVFNHHPIPARGTLEWPLSSTASTQSELFVLFRDQLTSRLFVRSAAEVAKRGLEIELAGFESVVLTDFRRVADDDDRTYSRLRRHLGLAGTPNLSVALRDADLDEARSAFAAAVETLSSPSPDSPASMRAIANQLEALGGPRRREAELTAWIEAVAHLFDLEHSTAWPATDRMQDILRRALERLDASVEARLALSTLALAGYLGTRWDPEELAELAPSRALAMALERQPHHPIPRDRSRFFIALVELAVSERWLDTTTLPGREQAAAALDGLRQHRARAAILLGYNRGHDSVHTETFDAFLSWRASAAALGWLAGAPPSHRDTAGEAIVGWFDGLDLLRSAVHRTDFRLGPVIEKLRGGAAPD